MDQSGYRALRLEPLAGDVLKVTIHHPTSPLNAVDDLLHGEALAALREKRKPNFRGR